MAAQEASGVMVVAMLWQQGARREVLLWESEVEGTMREMAGRVDRGGIGTVDRVSRTCVYIK